MPLQQVNFRLTDQQIQTIERLIRENEGKLSESDTVSNWCRTAVLRRIKVAEEIEHENEIDSY